MVGAIIGDVVGSRFEWNPIKTKDFALFTPACHFTDDSAMTLAVCDAFLNAFPENQAKQGATPDTGQLIERSSSREKEESELRRQAILSMQKIGRNYPNCGYGPMFLRWLMAANPEPYQSFGNGAAMRVSGCAYAAASLEEVIRFARIVTGISHDHKEGLKAAEAVAVAIFLARQGASLKRIQAYVLSNYYPIDFRLADIRPHYQFDSTCQGSVPQAFQCFFESQDFTDAIRNAVSLGGDSDTIAAITGSLAEAYYGVPLALREEAIRFLPKPLYAILTAFEARFPVF